MRLEHFLTYLLAICVTFMDAATINNNNQVQQQQQQQQIFKNPFGSIFGTSSTTSRPITNANYIGQSGFDKRPKPSRHPQVTQLPQVPQSQPGPVGEDRVIDRFNIRYPDGSYEFRYELVDGTARYERGYFLRFNKLKTLVVVGYYSYRLSDGRYLTVFYNADQFGYRQNQSITPQTYPNLPRSIDVPQLRDETESENSADNATPIRGNRF